MTVEDILEQVDDMIDKAVTLPLTGGKCLVEAERLRNMVDEIRASLPGEVRQAKNIVADRGQIITDAKKEAESIVRAAEDRARRMVAEEEIVKLAQARATEVLTGAQQKSREMKKSAFDFAEEVLKRTEETLAGRLSEIRQTRQTLRNPQGSTDS